MSLFNKSNFTTALITILFLMGCAWVIDSHDKISNVLFWSLLVGLWVVAGLVIMRADKWFTPSAHKGFPTLVKEHWYTGAWYMKRTEEGLLPKEEVVAFNCWTTGVMGKDTTGLIEGLIPAFVIDGKVGLYEIVKAPYYTRQSGNDRAGWDDGKYVDLKLRKVISKATAIATLRGQSAKAKVAKYVAETQDFEEHLQAQENSSN